MPARLSPPAPVVPSRLKRQFSAHLLAWKTAHGRSDLPWQNLRDPYRVWLSEIMLQQTQVSTVRDYYQRFLQRFPTVHDLAAAPLDEVLGLWSGLGYYSRARNLHRCAQQVVHDLGNFPRSARQLQTLPGIGASTAAAIASFCFEERAAIFDGNVQRVVARLLAFQDDLARAPAQRQLLQAAEQLLPAADCMPAYSQAIMDLGATVCLPRQPRCGFCPVQHLCDAQRRGEPESYPLRSRALKRSSQRLWLLWLARPDGSVWLERRPERGVWGGLHCLPVYDSFEQLQAVVPEAARARMTEEPAFMHALTHRDLHLHPVRVWASARLAPVLTAGQWWPEDALSGLGLPAPVRRLLQETTA
ncbi:MAG: A/G-specific adenine glycosylase [Betaproteobacteria bacterium]|nr:A/G-specific adenine glycosylase [Betaproteobacteria bacterium]